MGRMLSRDLRDRVVAAVEGGMSCRAAAERFGVSAASAIRWRQLVRQHGTPAAKRQGGDRRVARIEDHAASSTPPLRSSRTSRSTSCA